MSIGGANTLTIGAGGVTNDGTSTYTISTAVALRANQTWANNNTTNALAITGAVSGSGKNLTLAGAGGFTFSGANTYSGTTSLLSGTTLTLSGASGTLATSAISIEGGTTLNLDNTGGNNTDRIGNGAGITSRGGTIAPKGASATETVGTLTLSTGTTRVNVDAGSTASTALTLSGNGAATFNNAAQTAASLPSPANGVLTLNGTAFIVTAPTTFDGKFTGTGSLAHSSGNTLTLSGAETLNVNAFAGSGFTVNGLAKVTLTALRWGAARTAAIPDRPW